MRESEKALVSVYRIGMCVSLTICDQFVRPGEHLSLFCACVYVQARLYEHVLYVSTETLSFLGERMRINRRIYAYRLTRKDRVLGAL